MWPKKFTSFLSKYINKNIYEMSLKSHWAFRYKNIKRLSENIVFISFFPDEQYKKIVLETMWHETSGLSLFFYLFYLGGHTQLCTRVTPSSVLRNHSWRCLESFLDYWGSNSGQESYPLYYIFNYYTAQKKANNNISLTLI